MIAGSLRPLQRPITFTSNVIADLDSIKTALATATADINYSGANLNGANKTPLPDNKTGWAQWPAVTLSSVAGAYVNGSVVRYTGTYKGAAVIRTATIVGTDGNATFVADGPVDGAITNVYVAAQATTGGSLTHGFVDLECPMRNGQLEPWRACRGSTAANIGYVDRDDVAQYVPCTAGEKHEFEMFRLKTSTTTVTLVTLYE